MQQLPPVFFSTSSPLPFLFFFRGGPQKATCTFSNFGMSRWVFAGHLAGACEGARTHDIAVGSSVALVVYPLVHSLLQADAGKVRLSFRMRSVHDIEQHSGSISVHLNE